RAGANRGLGTWVGGCAGACWAARLDPPGAHRDRGRRCPRLRPPPLAVRRRWLGRAGPRLRSCRHAAPRSPMADGGRGRSVAGNRPGARGLHARNHGRHPGQYGSQPAAATRTDRLRLRVPGRPHPAETASAYAYQAGRLLGAWSLDERNPQRQAAWLLAATGELALGRGDPAVSELRLVLRPRVGGETNVASCRRLRVTLNDRDLGERLLETGWHSYVFYADASDFRPDGNVLTLQVRREPPEPDGAGERRATFRELTLHATVPGAGDHARPALSGPSSR